MSASEKDRFGEKLKEKEKAEEDRYFRSQDEALLEKIRQKSAPPVKGTGQCPKCGVALETRNVADVEIDECPKCQGLWLDAGELEALSSQKQEGWLSGYLRDWVKGGS